LAAARDVVLDLEMLAPKRSNGLSINPACANASRNSQIVVASGTGSSSSRSRKPHERQTVAGQVLRLLVREIVERLQHHNLELEDRS
jgi:hypothetical protein